MGGTSVAMRNIRQVASLAEILGKNNVLTSDQISLITQENLLTGRGWVKLLLDYGLIHDEKLQKIYKEFYKIDVFNPDFQGTPPQNLNLAADLLKEWMVFPFKVEQTTKTLHLAMVDCQDLKAQDQLRQTFACQSLIPYTATRDQIFELLGKAFPNEENLDSFLWRLAKLDLEKNSNWAVECLNFILCDAIDKGVSDIHFQPCDRFIALRYRIDGVLVQRCALHLRFWPMLSTRIKIASQMNITQNRLPQMGRLTHIIQGRAVDCRLSTHPICYGESIVIRLLDHKKQIISLKDLGLLPDQQNQIATMAQQPEGMIIFTGPTGSGKTTSLYALLRQLPAQAKNIVTLEDPIEYELPGIRQSQVDETLGFTFEEGVRSLLRQDPDVMLIGEIRDQATAKMALRSALTGHLVLTTLHTPSLFGVIQRFEDLGIQGRNLAGVIRCVVSQRLIRILCVHCKSKQGSKYISGQCAHCNYTGYKGRMAVAECLTWNESLDEGIAQNCTPGELLKIAQSQGFQDMHRQALDLIKEGRTTMEEVHRVVPWSQGVTP